MEEFLANLIVLNLGSSKSLFRKLYRVFFMLNNSEIFIGAVYKTVIKCGKDGVWKRNPDRRDELRKPKPGAQHKPGLVGEQE